MPARAVPRIRRRRLRRRVQGCGSGLSPTPRRRPGSAPRPNPVARPRLPTALSEVRVPCARAITVRLSAARTLPVIMESRPPTAPAAVPDPPVSDAARPAASASADWTCRDTVKVYRPAIADGRAKPTVWFNPSREPPATRPLKRTGMALTATARPTLASAISAAGEASVACARASAPLSMVVNGGRNARGSSPAARGDRRGRRRPLRRREAALDGLRARWRRLGTQFGAGDAANLVDRALDRGHGSACLAARRGRGGRGRRPGNEAFGQRGGLEVPGAEEGIRFKSRVLGGDAPGGGGVGRVLEDKGWLR